MTDVTLKSAEIKKLHQRIKPIEALLGGTEAMREANTDYLPKFNSELFDTKNGQKLYDIRLNKSTLVPYFEDTIRSMVGRVFHKPFVYELPESMEGFKSDFDMRGNSISEVFESCFFEALSYSKSFVVLDYSTSESLKTLAEEKEIGARPYAFKVDVKDVLDVRVSNGVISLFKYKRRIIDEKETTDFEVAYVDEIVLMKAGLTTIYRKNGDGNFARHVDYEILIGNKPANHVMVCELKLSRKPPLQNLADLNIKHWQSQSSQDNIVDTARIPILKLIGLSLNDKLDAIFVSGGLNLPVGADAGYVEHSGAAIESGQKSLDKLEEQMAIAGAKLITKTKMAMTDTQAKGEKEKEVSELMLYGMLFNNFINQVFSYFGEWLGVKQDSYVDITDNLQNTVITEGSGTEIIQSFISGLISGSTAFNTLQAKGVIVTNNTFEQEMEQKKIEEESGLSRTPSAFDGIQD